MKKLFFIGLAGLLFLELMAVYLIMPMPGSQQANSINLAYFLYQWRWAFRIFFIILFGIGLALSTFKLKWLPAFSILIVAMVIYFINFKMAADHMFYAPQNLLMVNAKTNKVDSNRLVIGITANGEARAYPIQFLGFHHQVYDRIGSKPVLITYCTVCRTGRVYEPIVLGRQERFRLVGMDHFNAMFEDYTTKSWWRQATGESIAGKLKGDKLPVFFSTQTSLGEWLKLNPASLVMQADSTYLSEYDSTYKFENGKSRSKLTGTDSLSGKNKSWVIGIKSGNKKKAYDWNKLKIERIIQDQIGNTPLLLVLANDDKSFFAFERTNPNDNFILKNDQLIFNGHHYNLNGQGIDTTASLKPLAAYQEFLHSWKTFNPDSEMY